MFTAEEGERRGSSSSFTYTEKFEEVFPYYLSIGMTYDQYWNDDPCLVKYYRKAAEIKREVRNQEFWLQGMYIYEALCDVSPLLHSFAKKGTRPIPYTDHPYPLSDKQTKETNADKERKVFDKGKKIMETFMELNNKRFKEVRENVHND